MCAVTAQLPADAPPNGADLAPTFFLDAEHPDIRAYARELTHGAADDAERARRIFAAVRDGVRYDPSRLPTEPAEYRASHTLAARAGYCVPKAVLLAAVSRAAGIPARLGFADVRNHLQSERLREQMGTDLFVWHGYGVLWIDGAWRKASPAFNAELCARFGVVPLDFDGTADALLHQFAGDGSRYMEYLDDHGVYADLPLDTVLGAYRAAYADLPAA